MPKSPTIARRFGLRASPNRSGGVGFVGHYSIPGKEEQTARDDTGAIAVFDTEDDAIAAAGEDLCDALNARSKFTYKHGYRKMAPAEFAVALAELEISPSNFAAFYGTNQRRVLDWIDGAQDIPHVVDLLMAVLAVPGMKTLVQQFTNRTMVIEETADGRD